MMNVATVQDEFIPLVALRKDENPGATQNPMGDLLTGLSGMAFNEGLITVQNLTSIAPNFPSYTYPAYSAGTTYSRGDIVIDSSLKYASISNSNIANTPASSPTYWRLTNPFNEWCRTRIGDAYIEMLNDWFNVKFENKTAANLIRADQVLNIPGVKTQGVGSTSRYLGFMVTPYPKMGVTLKVDRVSIQMIGSENLTVTLYKNGIATSNTVSFVGTGYAHVMWKQAGWTLERGNYYYIAYDRNSLTTAEPVNGLYSMQKSWPYNVFPGSHQPYAEVSAFQADSLETDLSNSRTNQNNFGLNITLSAQCDYTEFLVDQKLLFAQAGKKKAQIMFLKEFANNPNALINRLQLNAENKADIFMDINGDPRGRKMGLQYEYEQALNSISFDMPGLQKDCLPCSKKSVRYSKI